MVHTLAKEYTWSKSQIDEIYPEEATTLLKFIAYDKKDEQLRDKLDYYSEGLDKIIIQHQDPEKSLTAFKEILAKLTQDGNIQTQQASEEPTAPDDDLPDFDTINQLKNFQKSRR